MSADGGMRLAGRIVVVGLGLIGGSLALALKRSGYEGTIVGFDAIRENLADAYQANAVDVAANSLAEALAGADLVFVAVPLGAYRQLFREMAALVEGQDMVITDMGSVKGYVHRLAAQYFAPPVMFVGGHPMSGSEKGGFRAATPTLFENTSYFMTPAQPQSPAAERVAAIVRRIGATPVAIEPDEHDRVTAQISHVPHLAAAALVDTLENSNVAFVGAGFRDMTRIASGNPALWKDILSCNRREVLQALAKLEKAIAGIKDIIVAADDHKLYEWLQRSKAIQDCLPKRGGDYLPALFQITVDVEDRPGSIGRVAGLVGEVGGNIRQLEVLPGHDAVGGAMRLSFATAVEQAEAARLLTSHAYTVRRA